MSYHEDRREDKRGSWGSGGGGGDKWAARLYVGRLSRNVSERDIDDAFGKYGRIREVDKWDETDKETRRPPRENLEYLVVVVCLFMVMLNSKLERNRNYGGVNIQENGKNYLVSGDTEENKGEKKNRRRIYTHLSATNARRRELDGVRIQGNDERVLVEFAKGKTTDYFRDLAQEAPGADRPETIEIRIMVVAGEGVDMIVGHLKDVLTVVKLGIGREIG
ncbi:10806_t:CDS:2 [Ambispora leptoticha]|uniref:10806_t:CDS:1 n=1 Tax=Ambispora leptoticha TaxID=144679 RepID=A0A9N8VW35_9GLOM|nr:10806_t:CDS:2 [Ambispora leptoticha]